jgi:isocitrate lyase
MTYSEDLKMEKICKIKLIIRNTYRSIIADIDAGFGNEEATYLLTKKMIEAGACAIQIENQVSDAKQCGHQDGKVTVPHEDFIDKLNAIRCVLRIRYRRRNYCCRTDSEGAGLTQKTS